MAQTKRKRRRKRRGTQGGRIDPRGPRGRPRSRTEAKAQARRRAEDRRNVPPTWGRAAFRGLAAAAIFFGLMIALFGYDLGPALGLGAVMLALYIPLGFYLDRFFWRRRMRTAQRQKQTRG